MSLASADRFAALAERDATVAPLARLQAAALAQASDPAWRKGVPALARANLDGGLPLLHGCTLGFDEGRTRRLAERLAEIAGRPEVGRAFVASAIAPLVRAAARDDVEALAAAADAAGVDGGTLAVIARLATWPLFLAAGEAAAPLLADLAWDAGWCPLCGARPLLAESRGLERVQWLRCGRCALGWKFDPMRCVYCGNTDHRTQGYLAPREGGEARRATTCDACRGYLKAVASVGALSAAELALADLSTIELDVAAADRGFARPPELGFPLDVDTQPLPRSGLLGWRR